MAASSSVDRNVKKKFSRVSFVSAVGIIIFIIEIDRGEFLMHFFLFCCSQNKADCRSVGRSTNEPKLFRFVVVFSPSCQHVFENIDVTNFMLEIFGRRPSLFFYFRAGTQNDFFLVALNESFFPRERRVN